MIEKKDKILIFLLMLILPHVYSQNDCTKEKLNKLKTIYNLGVWNINYALLNSLDTTDTQSFDPYKSEIMYTVFLDSACNFFTEEEIDNLMDFPKKNGFPTIERYVSLLEESVNNPNLDFNQFVKDLYSSFDTTDTMVKRMMDFSLMALDIVLYWEIDLAIYESGYTPNKGIRDFYLFEYEKSLSYFENEIYNEHDASFENLYFCGLNLQALGKNQEALSMLRKAQNLSKFNSDADNELASYYFYLLFDTDSALIEIKKALRKEPEDFSNNLLLAEIYLQKKEFDNSIEICTDLINIKNDKERTRVLNTRGNAYLEKRELINAEKDYRQILTIEPNNIIGMIGIGNVFLEKGQLDSAFYYINKSYLLDKDNFLANLSLGSFYMATEDYAEAEKLYTRALEFYENSEYLNNLGFCKMKLEKYEESIEIFKKVINEYTIDKFNEMAIAFTYNNLGFCYYKIGQLEKAAEHIDKSLEIIPDNACAAINKALVFIEYGEKEKTCGELEKAEKMMFLEYCGIDYENLRKSNCN